MRRTVGMSLKIQRAWLDAFVLRVFATRDEGVLRSELDEVLKPALPGAQVRAKTAGILMRIWATVPAERTGIRDRALAMVGSLPGDDRLWLHWGMAALAYPFFRDTAEVVGRILALQDDFTTPQVQDRLAGTWGDRLTTRKSGRYLLNTMVDWGVLRATATKGHFGPDGKRETRTPELELWLAEALLTAASVDEIEIHQLLRLPESFPFAFNIGLANVRRHKSLTIHRQGVDVDIVALRPARPGQPAQGSRGKRRKDQGMQGHLFGEAT